jgi:Ca-activated chloride channel family protein
MRGWWSWAGAAVAAWSAAIPAQRPVFRAATDLVTVGVTVADRRGVLVTHLTREDFEVFEDGRPQTIALFARGEPGPAAPAIHVGLLLDTSGSMTEDIALARSAAVRFLNTLHDAADITLVDFSTEVHLARYGQEDFPRLVERIRSRQPKGFTALYDALALFLDSAAGNTGRTILVALTDGGDTRSTIDFGDLMTIVRASQVTVYPVGLVEHRSGAARSERLLRLTRIASETGGRAFFPSSMREIDDAYANVLAEIRAQYTVGYLSTDARRDGRWREVEIRVRPGALEGARVRARKGYFAPRGP